MKKNELESLTDSQLWANAKLGEKDSIDFLAERYIPLVEKIAYSMSTKLPSWLESGDLLSDGYFGLVDAITKFDPSKGFKFESYASNRIRGEINDQLRSYDWVSRYSRTKFKKLWYTRERLLQENQANPTYEQIADRLDWTVEEVLKVCASYDSSFPVNIEERMKDSDHELFTLSDLMQDYSVGDPGHSLEMADISDELYFALTKLNDKEATIIYLSHIEDMSLSVIAKIMEIGVSRVSQIYEIALAKLREHLIIS